MDDVKYEELLDKAYGELPEVLYKKDRFEVPEVRGRLVKSRTLITNFKDIAKHLERETDHFSKFMLRELGVRGDFQESKGELVLHSRFQPGMLNKAVKNYYDSYVQCQHCNSPDTELKENGTALVCKACGHKGKIAKL